jgi:hypothetical protein
MGHRHGVLVELNYGHHPSWHPSNMVNLAQSTKKWLLIIFKMDTVYMAEKYGEGFNYRSEIGHANPGTLPEFHGVDSTLFLGGMQHGNVDFIELTWC